MAEQIKKKRGGQKTANYELNESFPSKQLRKLEREAAKLKDEGSDIQTNPLVEARLQKLLKETEKLQLDIDIQKRNYIPAIEVSSAVSTEYTRVRQKLLSLESKLPHILAPISDPIEIRRIIQSEISEVLAELSYENEVTV
jgi:hypothetical protein